MRKMIRGGLVMTVVLSVLTGVLYPSLITGMAGLLFPAQAAGSLVSVDGQVVGSALVGQPFARPEYFHGRPSNAGAGYDGTASSGSNLGPTSAKLRDRVASSVDSLRALEAVSGVVPIDAVTASASGLDPHISPAHAALQVARVAAARGVPADAISALVAAHTDGRQLGLLGEPRVNVLLLNIALDSAFQAAAAGARPDSLESK
jgi:K+-transporting ATPase ATPase C chain